MAQYQLDAKNLFCPMPVIRTQDKIAQLNTGDILVVEATDPGVKNDIPAWCRINGHKVLAIAEQGSIVSITIQVEDEH